MTKKVKYHLDEADQIEVDGHTLSRLYLAENIRDPYSFSSSFGESEYMSRYAVFGEDTSGRDMGGYVESLDNLSDDIHPSGHIAWVDAQSKVYGTSRLGSGARVRNSTIVNSDVRNYSLINDSVVADSKVTTVMNSVISGSYCSEKVEESTIINSNVENYTINSKISDSEINDIKYSKVINANLNNVRYYGSLSGTFANVDEDAIERYQLSYRNQFDDKTNMKLLVGPSGLAVMPVTLERITLVNGKTIPAGDISLEKLSTLLNEIVDEQPIGGKKALKLLDKLSEREILTDSDLDFGETMER